MSFAVNVAKAVDLYDLSGGGSKFFITAIGKYAGTTEFSCNMWPSTYSSYKIETIKRETAELGDNSFSYMSTSEVKDVSFDMSYVTGTVNACTKFYVNQGDRSVSCLPGTGSGSHTLEDMIFYNLYDMSGGWYSKVKVDMLSQWPSYTFDANGPINDGLNGIGIGDRRTTMRATQYGDINNDTLDMDITINGSRIDSGNGRFACYMKYNSGFIWSWNNGNKYVVTKFTISVHAGGRTLGGNTADINFLIGGSNDGTNWTWLGAFNPTNTSYTPPSPYQSVTCYTDSGNYDKTSTSSYTANAVSGCVDEGNSGATRTYHFANTTAYNFITFRSITSNSVNSGNGAYVELGEVEFA